jgi:glycosyltransferase involved in cell wall biosynthesis
VLTHNFLKKGPSPPFRIAALFQAYSESSKQKVLFINHHLGGGIEKHMHELASSLQDEMAVVTLRPRRSKGVVIRLGTDPEGEGLRFSLPRHYTELLKLCTYLRVSRIHFHHIMGLPPMIRNLPKDLGIHYDMTVHDFHLIHSNPTLTDQNGRYYEDAVKRDGSYPRSPSTSDRMSEESWSEGQADFLRSAERIFIPSEFAARLFLQHFSDLRPIVTWHPDWEKDAPYPNPRLIRLCKDSSLRVASIGMLSKEKGADLFESCAKQAKDRQLPLDFHLIGYALRPMSQFIQVHGMYEDRELGRLISEIDPHVIWFPAQVPETYSYTLSAALKSGRPLVVPDIGAFEERVEGRPLTWVEPWDQPIDRWLDVFLALREKMLELGNLSQERIWKDQHELNKGFTYSADYLITTPVRQTRSDDSFIPSTEWFHAFICRNDNHRRETILRHLFKITRYPLVESFLTLIPYNRRRQIKRLFSRKPIHEIMRSF